MATTPDQRAVLELLLGSDQSYAELGELLDLEEGEVRARAAAGLEALGGADPDGRVGLTDYLLGRADPIGRADAVRHLRQHPEDRALAEEILVGLAELVPGANLPTLPPTPGAGPVRRTAHRPRAGGPPAPGGQTPFGGGGQTPLGGQTPFSGLTPERSRLYAILAGGAVILVAVVLALAGVFSGDEEAPEPTQTSATGGGDGAAEGIGEIPEGEELSRVPLLSVGSGDAAGAAIVGVTTGDQPYLDLIIENLDPAPQGQAYVVWFMFSKDTGYPLSPIFPANDGSFSDRFAIPTPVVGLVARSRAIEVSVSAADETLGEIQSAIESQTFEITRPGRTVLRGVIEGSGGGASG